MITLKRVKVALAQKEMNMAQLAAELGVHTNSIYSVLSGADSRPNVLAKLEEFCRESELVHQS
jgi:DNA-binding Xre family transcriptional regulator